MADFDLTAYLENNEPADGDAVAGADANDDGGFDLTAYLSESDGSQQAQPIAPRRPLTPQERIARNDAAIARAMEWQPPTAGEFVGESLAEGAKGAARAVKSIGQGIVGMASGAARLAGTPVRMATGWDGLHRLADSIDSGYDNMGADVLASEYGTDADGLFAVGRFGEKVAGIAGSLAALGGVGKAASVAGNALKGAGHAKTAAAVANILPAMFGNDAAVRTYETAKQTAEENGQPFDRARALALASVNGAIHFFGFKAFENASLNKMLGMPKEMEAMMPEWAGAAKEGGAKSFSDLVEGVRNGMFKHILAERGRGALKAGGIMGLQNFLSSVPTQMAEGASAANIDYGRAAQELLGGVGEGALMEGLMGGAAALKTPKAAKKFVADAYFRNGYELPNGERVPGLLETPEGRMALMKQNPAATERVLDIVEHGGTPRPDELDAAFLPTNMKKSELEKFAADWRNDLGPWVEDAWGAEAPVREAVPPADAAGTGREFLSPEEAEAQQRGMNEDAERRRVEGRIAEREQARAEEQRTANDEQERYNAQMLAREEARARAGQAEYDRMMEAREEARAQNATEATQDAAGARGAEESGNVPSEPPTPPEGEISRPQDNRLRPAAPREEPRPAKEKPNETGNVPDEAPAQPEEGTAGKPEAGEAARPVAGEPQGAEAPDARVVDTSAKNGTLSVEEAESGVQTADINKNSAHIPQDRAEAAENAPVAAPRPAEATTPPKPAEGVEGRKSGDTAKPTSAQPQGGEAAAETQTQTNIPKPEKSETAPPKLRTQAEADAARAQQAAKKKTRRGENLRGFSYADYGEPPDMEARTPYDDPGGSGDAVGAALLQYRKENGRLFYVPETKDDPLWDWYNSFNDGNARKNRRGDFIALFGLSSRKGRNDATLDDAPDEVKMILARGGMEAVAEAMLKARADFSEWSARKREAARLRRERGDAPAEGEPVEVVSLDEIEARNAADTEYDNAFAEVKRYDAGTPTVQNFSRERMRELKRGDKMRFDHDKAEWDVVDYDPEADVVTVVESGMLDNPLFTADEIAGNMVQYRVSENGFEEIRNGRENKRVPAENIAGDAQGAGARAGAGEGEGESRGSGAGQQAASGGDFALESATAEELTAERRRQKERDEIKRRQEAPLKGGGMEAGQTLLDLGGEEGEDLFNRTQRTEKPPKPDNKLRPAAKTRLARVWNEWAEGEELPAWAKKLTDREAGEYADLIDAALRVEGDDGGAAADAVSEFEEAHGGGAEGAKNVPASTTAKTDAMAPRKAAKPAEGADGGKNAPSAASAEMRQRAVAAMRVLGAESGGRSVAALEKELEALGGSPFGPAKRKADALCDLIEYKKATGTREVPPEEIAAARKREREERIIDETTGGRLPSEDFYGRREQRSTEPPKEWAPEDRQGAQRAADRIKGSVPGVSKVVFSDEVKLNSNGDVVHGEFNRATGEVTLYRGATAETAIHEIGGHATMKFAEDEAAAGRPELLNKLNAAIDSAPEKTWNEIKKRYADKLKEGKISEVRDEVLADVFGKAGDKAFRTLEGKAWYNRVWQAIKEVWRGMMRKMGFDVDSVNMKKLDRLAPEKTVDWLVKQMLEGKRFIRNGETVKSGAEGLRQSIDKSEYDRWNKILDEYERGGMKQGTHAIVFDHTPVVLRRLGAPDLPVNLNKDVIDKITGIVKTAMGEEHKVPVSELRNLQIELDNPIAVFDSKSRSDSMVVLTRIIDNQNHERAVVALHLDKTRGAINVNDIASMYGKDRQSIENWTAWGLLRYVNKQARKSSAKWFQLPSDSELRARSVLTEKDFSGEKLGQIISDDSSKSKGVSAKEDAAYMDAVKRGDTETAQRMVREAAKRKGYKIAVFHGTPSGGFSVFKVLPAYVTESKEYADRYQSPSASSIRFGKQITQPETKSLFLDPRRMFDTRREAVRDRFFDEYAQGGEEWVPVSGMNVALSRRGLPDWTEAESIADYIRAKHLPYDSIVVDEGGYPDLNGNVQDRGISYAVLKGSKLKSADPVTYDDAGNVIPLSQRFNSASNDIREARAPLPPDSQRGRRLIDDERTKGEKLEEKLIDRHAPVRTVQEEVGGVKEVVGADGYTDHKRSTDFVAAADKANGRVEHEMRELDNKSAAIDEALAKAALPGQSFAELLNDFDLYLQCKHAAERNRTIAERNGVTYDADYYYGMGKVERNGTKVGLSENVANDILAEMTSKYGNLDKFEEAAQKVYEINRADIQQRVEAGRLTVQDANQYLYRWQRYVPLKTDMERLEPEGFNSSTASMRRNEFMRARGRANADIADSPLAASILQAEQGIRGSVKNEVLNVAANLVEHAAAQGKPIGEIVRGESLPQGAGWTFALSDGSRVTAGGSMRLADNRPDVLLFKRDGELMAIRIDKGANGRGLAIAKAMSGENMSKWGGGMEWVPRMTQWMSAMRTQYSPEFTVSNLLADHLEAYQALVGRYGIKGGTAAFGKMVASEIHNFKALRQYLRGGLMSGDVGEAVRAGLLTKGGVASEGFEGKEQSIKSRIEQFRRKERAWRDMSVADWVKSGWSHLMDYLSFANELAEYSTRMGIFSAMKKQILQANPHANHTEVVRDAVKFARNATVNFNRKGTAMPLINGLYMFANASAQGAVRSVQAMRDTHGKELVGLLVGVGVAKALIDNYLGNDDDREKAGGRNARNMSEYDRKHNVGVPIPGTSMQIVPFRFRGPYAAIPYLAQTAANVALGNKTPSDGAKTLFRELGDQVTDVVGGNGIMNDKGEIDGALALQSLAPSVADPFVQLASGKDYKGEERKKLLFDKTAPASSNGKRSTPAPFKAIAKGINAIPFLSGGNENRKGRLDIAPEDLQLVWEFLLGGIGRDAGNLWSTGQNIIEAAKGGKPERTLSQTPFLRRIVREYPENTSRYYEAVDAYNADKAEFKKTTEMKRRAELKKAKPYLFAGKSLLDGQIEQVRAWQHRERGEVKSGNKWVEPKKPIPEEQKRKAHEQRLKLQAKILRTLGG